MTFRNCSNESVSPTLPLKAEYVYDASRTFPDRTLMGSVRIATFEWLRLISAFGIVWFHVKAPGALIAYGGLPVFMILSVMFADWGPKDRTVKSLVKSRVRRMLWPWLSWSFVYALAKVFQAMIIHRPLSDEFHWSMILVGPALHLWYLPFGFAVTVVIGIHSLRSRKTQERGEWLGRMGLMVGCLFLFAWALERTNGLVPLAQWFYIFPAIFIGLVMATIKPEDKWFYAKVILVGGTVIGACGMASVFGFHGLTTSYTCGIIAFVFACFFRGSAGSRLLKISGLSFGVYLVHPLVISILTLGCPHMSPTILGIVTIIVSLIVSAGLRRTPLKIFI